jgi:hypothetical protein
LIRLPNKMGEMNDGYHNILQCVPSNIYYPSSISASKRHRPGPTTPSNWMDSASYNDDTPFLSVDSSIESNKNDITAIRANLSDYNERKTHDNVSEYTYHQHITATGDRVINENLKTTSSELRMLKHKRRYCRMVGCKKIVKSQGLCQRHGAITKKCKIDTCHKQAQGNFDGMCSTYIHTCIFD